MSEVGKAAKRAQRPKARDLRALDPEPLRATPAKARRSPERRRFGFSYEMRLLHWHRYHAWFETERARDQAFVDFKRKHLTTDIQEYVRCLRKEERV